MSRAREYDAEFISRCPRRHAFVAQARARVRGDVVASSPARQQTRRAALRANDVLVLEMFVWRAAAECAEINTTRCRDVRCCAVMASNAEGAY